MISRLTLAVAVAAACLGCDRADATQKAPVRPRIVTVGGQVTEIAFAVGAGDHVVAVDTSSTYPAAVAELPTIGYQRAISVEGVLAQRPTLVLATAEAGPPAAIAQLRRAGVKVVSIPADKTVDGAKAAYRGVAAAVERTGRGEQLVRQLDRELDRAAPVDGAAPRVLFVYARSANLIMASGAGTGPDEMIRLAGGRNAITGYTGYRPLSAEAVVAAAPDVVLIPTRGADSLGGVDAVLALPGIALTPAGKRRRVVAMDDQLLLAFGALFALGLAL